MEIEMKASNKCPKEEGMQIGEYSSKSRQHLANHAMKAWMANKKGRALQAAH